MVTCYLDLPELPLIAPRCHPRLRGSPFSPGRRERLCKGKGDLQN